MQLFRVSFSLLLFLCCLAECMLWFEVCCVLICLSSKLTNIVEYEILFLSIVLCLHNYAGVWWILVIIKVCENVLKLKTYVRQQQKREYYFS